MITSFALDPCVATSGMPAVIILKSLVNEFCPLANGQLRRASNGVNNNDDDEKLAELAEEHKHDLAPYVSELFLCESSC